MSSSRIASRAGSASVQGSETNEDPMSTADTASKKRKAPASRAGTSHASNKKPSSMPSAAPKRKNGKAASAGLGDGSNHEGDRDQSLGIDIDDDDDDGEDDDKLDNLPRTDSGGQKPKGTARKAQNRNAQRESRQRKAEYVRALEGLVALHKVDMSSQLQGLLFAIGWLIDENMRLRSTLGALSTLFSDPTQGSRLPDIGVNIVELKTAVERNDKSYLLDLGERLRERVGMHGREAQAQQLLKEQGNAVEAPSSASDPNIKPSGPEVQAPGVNDPIYGNLTAKAEAHLLEKIRQSGHSVESGGWGTLFGHTSLGKDDGCHDGTAESSTAQSRERDQPMAAVNASEPGRSSEIAELWHIIEQSNRTDMNVSSGINGTTSSGHNRSSAVPQANNTATNSNSNTSTPIDFNEYLHSSMLGGLGSLDDQGSAGTNLNQFLFQNGPSPPGFQMPDFANLGNTMNFQSSYNSNAHTAPYQSHGFGSSINSFLQPPLLHTVPSPAFGIPTASSSGLGASPHDRLQATVTEPTLPNIPSTTPMMSTAVPSPQLTALKETSKTLHKQAKQLIKFHLRSKQEDSAHELPSALTQTAAQGIMPHDPRIDGILWPAMRDRLIFSSGKIDLEAVLLSLDPGDAVIVHASGDLMDPQAWELSESFVHTYPGLLDGEILKTCNTWRTLRGETHISL